MRKRGLVIIYDPHALMQFLQFYCMGDFEADWDALCLPEENGREDMHIYCEKSGLFRNIYTGEDEYMSLSVWRKTALFIPLLLYSVVGKQKICCTRILNQYVEDISRYEILAANTENGFISGMTALLGDEKDVIYFEDGMGEYMFDRNKWKSTYKTGSFASIQSVVMSRLGYCAKGYTYLKSTRNCYKYVSVKQEFLYQNYKEIRQFVLDDDALDRYRYLLLKIYPELKNLHIENDTAVVFTDVLEDLTTDCEEYVKKYIDVVCASGGSILLKRHPRDHIKYVFPETVKVYEISQKIAAELIFPYLNGNKCFLMLPNSLILGMGIYNVEPVIVFSQNINRQMRERQPSMPDRSKQEKLCRRFLNRKYTIIDV